MPDLLTGEQEKEVIESIQALNDAIALLDPGNANDAIGIQSLQQAIEAIERVMDEEIPTPILCPTCTPPEHLPATRCERSGHLMNPNTGFAQVYDEGGKAYLKLGEAA